MSFTKLSHESIHMYTGEIKIDDEYIKLSSYNESFPLEYEVLYSLAIFKIDILKLSFDSGTLMPCVGKYRYYKYSDDFCDWPRFDFYYREVNQLRKFYSVFYY